jgi:hypothetical protein
MNRHLQLATLLVATGLSAVAQTSGSNSRLYRSGGEWVQEITGSMPASKLVKIKSSAGFIKVQGGQQTAINYVIREHVRAASEAAARRELNHMSYSTTGTGETATLRAECEGYNRGYIDFEVQVPRQTAALTLETKGGIVTAKNVAGKVDASTGGGDIQLDQIGGLVNVSSGGGTIDIGQTGSDVRVSTGGGNIHIGSAGGRVMASSGGGNLNIGSAKLMNLETGGGWIKVNKCEGSIKAATGGGTIDLNQIDGLAQIQSGGGGIKIGPIRSGMQVETGSGPIIATLAKGSSFSDSRLETSVGSIIVYVPDDLGVTIRAAVEVARGDGIRSDFPELKITRSGNIGTREAFAEGSLNGGGPVLHVHTATGNIEFRRKGKE